MTNPHTAAAADLVYSHRKQAVTGNYLLADDAKFFAESHWITDKSVVARVLLERAIIRRAATMLIERGHPLRVHNGEEFLIGKEGSTDISVVMGLIMQTDEDVLRVLGRPGTEDPTALGTVSLIYGNDGWDVMADCSVALSGLLEETYDFADACGGVL